VFNALDFPAAIIPVGTVEKTDTWAQFPPVSASPLTPKDEWYRSLYDDGKGPLRYEGAPVSIQIAGRRFHDEKVLRITSRIQDLLLKKAAIGLVNKPIQT
jgi:amidase